MAESTPESPDGTEIDPDEDADVDVDTDAPDAEAEEAEAEETGAEEADAVETGSDGGGEESLSESNTPQAFSAIIEANRLDQTINTLSVIVDESRIHLNELGIRLAAVDPASVAMDETTVTEDAFESYQADGGVLGVDLDKLSDVVSMADEGDLIQMSLDPKTRKLLITFGGLEYTLALIDPDSIRQETDIPDLDLPARVVIEGSNIDRAVRAADMVSDHIEFIVDADDEVFRVHAEGDTDDVDLELGRDDLIDLEAGTADSLFSLDYLKDLNKAIPKDTEVELLLGEDFPAMLSYGYADGAATVTQMLAPRIQSD
jgi:proliferating cell nuclear antigen